MTAENMTSHPCEPADNQAEFTIQAARRTDIPEITRLNAQLGYPESRETVFHRYRRIVRDRRDHRVFVAFPGPSTVATSSAVRPDRGVIGWIHVFVDKLLTVGPRAEIGGLVVDERWRSRGVGAALVGRAEQWAQQRGFTQVVVRTNVVRTRAHGFYEKCGYELLKQSRMYTKVICK
jgi:GNAT superfamily N-acetyltransferase